MKKYIGVIACLLILCATCTGCGLALLGGLTFSSESQIEVVESVVFPNSGLERVEGGDVIAEASEMHCEEGEINTGETQNSLTVDSGLTVIEVTSQNLYQTYDKYGIETTGVIIIESDNTDELKCGDKVTEVNGRKISTPDDIDEALLDCRVGDVVTVVVQRGEESVSVSLTLKEKIPDSVDFG